ncbi:Gfo/Idh/MocA family protein [Antarctobacter heliothermus]|uniref:Predicted dehydrogenase n=1 Tax=Antarctobacter heliothermus TaxID=74033 RepID=A0A239IJF3_9RHOB|nr:Gfo/Idh/MocA family oxidoreductase [Antarctobacter heliothermus]SNS93681.1 Predicted dehydrogenase [Antarctobacter heliothermus]
MVDKDTGPLRVACLGAGYFSRFHYDGWRRIAGVELVGSCDLDAARARNTRAPAFDDLATMLRETAPDLLDVIVPPPAQAQAIRTALAAGVRALICQKPFCTSAEEALAVTQEAEAAGALLVIHENFRFQPWYRVIKAQLEAGAIGEVLQITFRLRPGDGQGPDAYLDRQPYFQQMPRFLVHETAVHWIDTFRYLLGAPSAVYADLRQVNPVIAGEDAGYILFDFPTGARALFDGNRLLDHAATNTRCTMGEALVEGTTGTLTLTGDGALHLRHFGTQESACILPPDTSGTFGGDCVFALQSHVVSCLRSGAHPENTARAYLPVIATEFAIYSSASEGRKLDLNQGEFPNGR